MAGGARFLRRLAHLIILPCLIATLAGCSAVDSEQDSLCRRAIPALLDTSGGIRILQSTAAGNRAVSIRFRLGDDSEHRLACLFAGAGLDPRKRTMVALVVDGQRLSDAGFHLLTSRWLESPLSVAQEPPPAPRPALFEPVPAAAALGLQHVLAALPKMGVYALIAAAYALVYGLTGRINLAFGGFAALGGGAAALAVTLIAAAGLDSVASGFLGAVLAGGGVAALFGAVAGRLIVAPLALGPGQQALIGSVGLMIALEEFLRLSQGPRTLWLAPVYNTPVAVARSAAFDATVTPMALAATGIAAAMAIGLTAFLNNSRFGRAWRALADEPQAAELFGVDPVGVLARSVAVAAGLAGLAGMIVVVHFGGIGFAGGRALGLTALVAAVLGGIGSVSGAMAGGVLIGLFEAAWSAFRPMEHREIAIFLLLSILLILKPDGLFGGRLPGPERV